MTVLPTPGAASRTRADRCPGVLRPWVAEDGALLRIRLVGGVIARDQLAGLADLAARHGDGSLHATSRANVQVRGVPVPVPAELVERLSGLGLLPAPAHERVRNVMMSPLTGRVGGAADLRPVARALDAALCADAALAQLPARFLFCLDDRGDLVGRGADLAAVAVDQRRARLHAGGLPGEVVALEEVAGRLVGLARRFLELRGTGPSAPWHVTELPAGGAALGPFAPSGASGTAASGAGVAAGPAEPLHRPAYGSLRQDDGRQLLHLPAPDGRISPALVEEVLATGADTVVVTPWRSLLLPDLEAAS